MRDLGRLLELIVRNSAPLPSVVQIFLFTLPTTFTITLPMGVLVGILVGLSRLAADSEVTAMRASGMGVGMFIRVISIFAVAGWMLGMLNSIYVAPRSAVALDHLQERLRSSQASFEIEPRVFYEEFKNIVLYVQDVVPSGGRSLWRGVFLADISDPASPKITLAQRGALLSDSPEKLRFHLEDGTQQEIIPQAKDQYSITTFEGTEIPIELPSTADRAPRDLLPLAELGLRGLLQSAAKEERAARALRPTNPAVAGSHQLLARFYEIEFHRRFALPAACLVLGMVGIPLGLSARKGGKSTGFVLTILLVFVYYFFSLIGVSMARQGKMPPWEGVWMANIFFFLCGLVLLWRVDRMPIEIGGLSEFWKWLKEKLPAVASSRSVGEGRRIATASAAHRRRFSARFPLILDDMILRDFALYLAMIIATALIIVLVFTYFELLTDIMRNRIPAIIQAEYLWDVSPSLIYLIAPLAVMLAVLITFGLMEKSSELTAMKASGMSIYRAALPVVVLCAFFAVGLFIFDQLYIPHTNREQEILRNQIKGKPAQTYLQADRKWIFGQSNEIYYYQVFDPDTNHFGGISIFEFDPNTFQLTRRIHAERAHWEENLKKWVFETGWVRTLQGASIRDYSTFDVATFNELREDPMYFK